MKQKMVKEDADLKLTEVTSSIDQSLCFHQWDRSTFHREVLPSATEREHVSIIMDISTGASFANICFDTSYCIFPSHATNCLLINIHNPQHSFKLMPIRRMQIRRQASRHHDGDD